MTTANAFATSKKIQAVSAAIESNLSGQASRIGGLLHTTDDSKTNSIISQITGRTEVEVEKPNIRDFRLYKGNGLDAFHEANASVADEVNKYADIRSLNVHDKETLTLDEYNPDYVAPIYQNFAYSAYNDLQNSFKSNLSEISFFENFRKEEIAIDTFSSLVEAKFSTSYSLKYVHTSVATTTTSTIDTYSTTSTGATPLRAVGTLTLTGILTIGGVGQAIIAAIKACVDAIVAAISSLGIPFIGWAIFVAVLVAALAVLAYIIIENWDEICVCWQALCDYLVNTYSVAAAFFNEYFAVANDLIAKSTYAGKMVIGDTLMKFQEVQTNDRATVEELEALAMMHPGDIYLMCYVTPTSFQICWMPVTFEFCVAFHTHLLGISSYTYSESVARDLIVYAGTGLTTLTPYSDVKESADSMFWPHYHNYMTDPLKIFISLAYMVTFSEYTPVQTYPYQDNFASRVNSQPTHRCHSFFGASI